MICCFAFLCVSLPFGRRLLYNRREMGECIKEAITGDHGGTSGKNVL